MQVMPRRPSGRVSKSTTRALVPMSATEGAASDSAAARDLAQLVRRDNRHDGGAWSCSWWRITTRSCEQAEGGCCKNRKHSSRAYARETSDDRGRDRRRVARKVIVHTPPAHHAA